MRSTVNSLIAVSSTASFLSATVGYRTIIDSAKFMNAIYVQVMLIHSTFIFLDRDVESF